MKRTLIAALALSLTATLAACGEDEDPDAIPESTPNSSSPTPTEPSETQTTPSWEDDYTPEQLRLYEAALQRFESYEQRSEPIWAEGKATATARALFEEYFPSPLWQTYQSRLESYEQVVLTIEGSASVYWSKATSITKDSVTIEQCVDYTSIKAYQDGELVEPEPWATEPRLRTIDLSKPEGYNWLIYTLTDSASTQRPGRCDP